MKKAKIEHISKLRGAEVKTLKAALKLESRASTIRGKAIATLKKKIKAAEAAPTKGLSKDLAAMKKKLEGNLKVEASKHATVVKYHKQLKELTGMAGTLGAVVKHLKGLNEHQAKVIDEMSALLGKYKSQLKAQKWQMLDTEESLKSNPVVMKLKAELLKAHKELEECKGLSLTKAKSMEGINKLVMERRQKLHESVKMEKKMKAEERMAKDKKKRVELKQKQAEQKQKHIVELRAKENKAKKDKGEAEKAKKASLKAAESKKKASLMAAEARRSRLRRSIRNTASSSKSG